MQPKILIVDDERQFVEMLSLRLAAHGYEVIAAHDGAQGIALADAHQPDLILMDWFMPDMDGPQAARAIRAREALAAIPIIFLTAMLGEERRPGRHARTDGDVVMPKTVGPVRLLEQIQASLAKGA
jgi:two-component system, cell cycle response regulator DivK